MDKFTDSPLNNPEVQAATTKAVNEQYGEGVAGSLFGGQDKEENLDLDLDIVDSNKPLNFDPFIDALQDTQHLTNFEEFNKYLGLDGKSYSSFKKALWYQSHSLKQPTLSYKVNYKTNIDNRVHILGVSEPATGKSTTKYKMRKLIDEDDCIETAGLCHPQQMVGKTVAAVGKKPKQIIPGYLSYKFLIHDEVQDVINEKNDLYAATQKLKRQAMDTYGTNIIEKKLVANMPGEIMKCMSPSRCLDFAHPKKLESPFFDTGSFRRYFIFNLTADEEVDLDNITEFKLDGNKNYDRYPMTLENEGRKNKWKVKFNQQTLDIIAHCHGTILKYLLKHENTNAFRYGMMIRYDLRAKISKMVYILALANGETIPGITTTIMACRDTLLFILESIKSINHLANIGITSDVWHGLNEEDAIAMTWLLRKGIVSLETSDVTIKKLWTVLGHIYGCKITQARAHYYKLKKDGFIHSKKTQKSSRVWLKFIPKSFKIIEKGDENGFKFLENLAPSVGLKYQKKDVLTLGKDYFKEISTQKQEEMKKKFSSDGSVGVWGYVLVSNILCVKFKKYNIIKYIYNTRGVQPTLPTVEEKQPILKGETTIKGAKTPKTQPTLGNIENEESEEESTRDVQYFDDNISNKIKKCSKEEVLKHIKDNPDYKLPDLLQKFGPGAFKIIKEIEK